MHEARRDALDDVLCLARVCGCVSRQGVEDEDLPPLRALIDGCEELLEDGARDLKDLAARGLLQGGGRRGAEA